MKRTVLAWGPPVLWALVLFFLSELRSAPSIAAPLLAVPDKLLHFLLYAALGVLLAWARHTSGARVRHGFLVALGSAYGAADEWHQSFVPGRSPDVLDWVADVAGVVVGYFLVVHLLGRGRASRKPKHADSE